MSVPLLFLPNNGSSFYVLLQLSLYSKTHLQGRKLSLSSPREVVQKICANKTNIYASAEICCPNSPLHEQAGRLLTGPQITLEVTTAVDLAGLLITLGQTETIHKAPLAQSIALKLLPWKNKVGRLVNRSGRLWWQLIRKSHLILKI